MAGFNMGYNPGFMNSNYMPQVNPYTRNDGFGFNDFQMRQNQPSIKIVESELNVQNLDVPMDGNAYYFLKADGTEIYSKFWTKEMKTKINKYVLVNDEVEQNEGPKLEDIIKEYFNDMEGNICSKLDSLDKRLNSFDKVTTKAKPKEEK